MITFTQEAKDYLSKVCDDDGLNGVVNVRVALRGGGCAGFTHQIFIMENEPDPLDDDVNEVLSTENRTINVVCDPLSLQYLDGTVIDYVQTLQSSGFKFMNENMRGTCGCGKSSAY